MSRTFEEPVLTVLEPGLVHIRSALTQAEQEWLAQVALQLGEREKGFYVDGKLNSSKTRGRIYDSLQRYPEGMQHYCIAQVSRACEADPAMPMMTPSHLLLLKYATERGIGFHRDNSENDGAGDFPVVSLSIGNSSIFTLKHHRDSPETKLLLSSGDAVLFGGPCRQILHAVTEVHAGTAPRWLPVEFRNSRLNFTFRHAPEILGREEDFKIFNAAEAWKRHAPPNQSKDPANSSRLVGEPRRLCPVGRRPYTKSQFAARHGSGWEEVWQRAPPGPATAAEETQVGVHCGLEQSNLEHDNQHKELQSEKCGRRRWQKA